MSGDVPLYIGNLPLSVDIKFLTGFIKDNNVDVIDIVLKTKKNVDSKFAFVKFKSMEDAKKVIEELNYTKLDARTIRMSLADAETKRLTKSNEGNLFIKKLDPSIEIPQLHEAFSNFGEIISCFIPQTDGKSRGYGFVQFRNKDDAERAKSDLSNATFNGKMIEIKPYSKQSRKNIEETYTNIYIKDFPENYTEEYLKGIFEEIGPIQNFSYQKHKFNEQELPYSFINYERHEDAVEAVHSYHNKEVEGKKWYVQRAQTKAERKMKLNETHEKMKRMRSKETRRRNLYVRGFTSEFTTDDLKNAFSQFGDVESCVVMRDPSPPYESKLFGFVCFKSEADASECIRRVSGDSFFTSENRAIYVSYAQRKEDREKTLAMEFNEKNQNESPITPTRMTANSQVPIAADQIDPPNALHANPIAEFPGVRNFKSEVIKKINELCLLNDAKKLISSLKFSSPDQIRIIALDESIFNSWKTKWLDQE